MARAGRRRRAVLWRGGGRRGRREPRCRGRRAGADLGRLGAAAGRRHPGPGTRGGPGAVPSTPPAGRCRRRLRARGDRRRRDVRARSLRALSARAAGHGGRLGRRGAHGLVAQPEPVDHAHRAGDSPRPPGELRADRDARRGRRLRAQDAGLPGGRRRGRAGAKARPSPEMDRGAPRKSRRGDSGTRAADDGRGRRRGRWHVARSAGARPVRRRRLSRVPDDRGPRAPGNREHPAGPLSDAGVRIRGARAGDSQTAARRLSSLATPIRSPRRPGSHTTAAISRRRSNRSWPRSSTKSCAASSRRRARPGVWSGSASPATPSTRGWDRRSSGGAE